MNFQSTFIKIKETYVLTIENMINIIIAARVKYEQTVANNNSKEEKLVKKVKKNKITSEEYYEYLALQGVLKNNESED